MNESGSLLDKAKAHTYDITHDHTQKEDSDGSAHKHIPDEAIVGAQKQKKRHDQWSTRTMQTDL